MRTYIDVVCDVEACGPCPGLYSMIECAFVPVRMEYDNFHCHMRPFEDSKLDMRALEAIKRTTKEIYNYPPIEEGMEKMRQYLQRLKNKGTLVFWSDNPAFDWQFVNFYLHRFYGSNPFGFSARRIGDLYAGQNHNPRDATSWKYMRTVPHTHNALDDAMGNAGALRILLGQGVPV
jgi:hypothetical protein